MKTSVGELHFDVPQVRESGFRTQVFERWQRSDKALISAMQEMVVQGVSTRRVGDILEEMGGFAVSAATVSKSMAELDGVIEAFFSRPLKDAGYPYLIVDARYEKVRRNGRVRSQAVLIATGIRDDGRRELLSLALGDSESAQTWGELFLDLKKRGITGVELLVSDAHQGIRSAFDKHFQGAIWQRCRVHFMREMLKKVSSKGSKELAADLRSIYASEERELCLLVASEVAEKWEGRGHDKLAKAIGDGVEDTLAVWDFDRPKRRKLNSTNMIERLMKEIKARTRKIGSFPNEQSCRRLIGAVLLEVQDNWDMEEKRYIVMND
jgi:transposase-like protein